jgi:hypothetical protein
MANPYYYLFYLIARFFKRITKINQDAYESSSAIISMCFLFHVLAIWVLLYHLKNIKLTTIGVIIALLPILFINFRFLTKNDKGEKLFNFYDGKFAASKNKTLIVTIALLYIVFSLGSAIYLGVIYGKQFQP